MDIAVVGSTMVDLISYIDRLPADGETVEAPEFAMGFGGKGANQAVAAARLGAEVMMVARVGSDLFGPLVADNLKANGVDTSHVTPAAGTNGVAPIFVSPDGSNRVLIIKGANAQLSATDIDAAADALRACRLLVLQLEVPLPTVYAAIDFAQRHDIPVLLNPAPATRGLDYEQVRRCDFFVPNETELALLTGMPVTTLAQIRGAARTLVDRGVKHVIVTLGSRGALWVNHIADEHIPGSAVDPVDSTGAGDAFIGSFAKAWVEHGDILTALHDANRYAADSVTKRGTQTSYATPTELQYGAENDS